MAESLEHVPHDTAVPVSKNTVSPPLIPADKSRFDWWQNDPLPASRVAHTLSPVLRARERPVSIWIWHDWIGSGIRTSRGAIRAGRSGTTSSEDARIMNCFAMFFCPFVEPYLQVNGTRGVPDSWTCAVGFVSACHLCEHSRDRERRRGERKGSLIVLLKVISERQRVAVRAPDTLCGIWTGRRTSIEQTI